MKNQIWRTSLFLLFMTNFGGVTHAEQQNSEDIGTCGSGADFHMYEVVHKPKTAIDLFSNAKIAINKGLLLRWDFYSKDILNKFFAAINIKLDEKESDKGRHRWATATHFENLFPDSMPDPGDKDYPIPNVMLSADRDRIGLKETGIVTVTMRREGPTFAEVNAIFNSDLQRNPNVRLDGPPPDATDPHGNENWYYQEKNNCSTKIYADFSFGSNGRLTLAIFSERN